MNNIIATKLRDQAKDNKYLQFITDNLLQKSQTDIVLEEGLAKDRTLGECWEYIKGKAKAESKNGCACIEDNVVYGWAVEFYKLSDEEFEKLKPKKEEPKKITPKVEKVENEPQEEAEDTTDDGAEETETVKEIEAPKRDYVPEKKKVKPETTLNGQASIFDFMGA